MAPTAEGPDSSFPEFPVFAYFWWGADPPVAPQGKLSRSFASGSANVLRLVVAEGSDAHFLCRDAFSFTDSLLRDLCPAAADSRASISVTLFRFGPRPLRESRCSGVKGSGSSGPCISDRFDLVGDFHGRGLDV
ncbi:hypothetical protein EYF80_040043 [Liparis tanakae]|uniref:Uncharacterized protein n=1 Tax=Liparis tanakae TaxID=230148 RepID=A0A4Z2G8X4_9TELE|nr:hypothetical protein EYF80_040043 [Liparis tanakae]